jgi:hypothetical protein
MSIPTTYSASVERPFDPISVRLLTTQLYDRNNERLTEEQVKSIIDNPQPGNPNARIEQLTDDANEEAIKTAKSDIMLNFSFPDMAKRLASTVHDILDDLLNYSFSQQGIQGFIGIFTKGDRLMFIGIIMILITLAVIFFRAGDHSTSSTSPASSTNAPVAMCGGHANAVSSCCYHGQSQG